MRLAGDCCALLRWGSRALLLGALTFFLPLPGHATGTAAGTQIGNSVTLSFTREGKSESAIASAAPFTVAKVINVVVTSQDSAPVPSNSPDLAKPVAFLVSNTGNGAETFSLARNNALAGDQFAPLAPTAGAIWIESGAEPGFQATGPNADHLYTPGVNDLALPPDGSRVVYLLSNIPAGQPTGAYGRVSLVATSTTAGAASATPGMHLATSASGVQTVVGLQGGSGSAVGSYLVSGVSIGLAKNVVSVSDPEGGARVMSGAVITYRLVLTLAGTGVAQGVTVTDPLPATLTYVAGSLTVDGAPRTDVADSDDSSVTAGSVQAAFGNVAAPARRVIEFRASVN